ncbi:MAG: ATP-dependent endonuclease [Chitinophagales bacterium]|nr:MAG: ATP-dependent endonuclease [Chitinophagales bacterium]
MTLSPDQQSALHKLKEFVQHPQSRVFLLKGYAGTGKTTLIKHLADWLKKKKISFALMATTGRAAKVLEEKTGYSATTIHSLLYAFTEIKEETEKPDDDAWAHDTGQLFLKFDLRADNIESYQLYIIDEASMISHLEEQKPYTARFGSGNLLFDLMKYVASKKIIFTGDPCQLPPVSSDPFSAALDKRYLMETFRVPVQETILTTIVRQNRNSEILQLANPFRTDIETKNFIKWIKINTPRGSQATLLPDEREWVNHFVRTFRAEGPHHAIIINSSNFHCARVNKFVRIQLYPGKGTLQHGELLMVMQNSYTTGLLNGDQVVVEFVGKKEYRAYLSFIKVRVRNIHNQMVYETLLIEDLLYDHNPGIQVSQFKHLLIDFDRRMRNYKVKRKSDEYRELMLHDPYLNALRAKFGYGITVHKAQGGEWKDVYLNINKGVYNMPPEQLYRWYYTAITRAQNHLYINDGFWIKGFDARQYRRVKGFSWE